MIFTARFLIGCWSAKYLLQWESAIFHSIKLGFEEQVAKKFLNGIYCESPLGFFLYFVACMVIPVRSSVILLWYHVLALKAERMPDKLSRAFTITCVHFKGVVQVSHALQEHFHSFMISFCDHYMYHTSLISSISGLKSRVLKLPFFTWKGW